RIFVNLAQETDLVARERLLGMARRLYRFTGMISLVALVLGVWLLAITWSFWKGPGNGWLHAKLFLVVLVIGYQHACGSLLKKFEHG
ncbi:CopD family protein, partial [Acinetobacter baumannii]